MTLVGSGTTIGGRSPSTFSLTFFQSAKLGEENIIENVSARMMVRVSHRGSLTYNISDG